ncbi:MAG: hypothetical protein CVV12_14175 [Gammaproteobacteria bacterium HGW-Gammaproteobacteria-2]|nr:MAG: hypothetical protein CVV12_14175 [Gammaproteobacteria bacterium HGW-Gammaproteobacteria-2]
MQSWAHARRKFFDIAKHGNTPTASGALERINALFEIERQASEANLDHEARGRWRAEHAKPKLDELRQFLDAEQQQLLPNTPPWPPSAMSRTTGRHSPATSKTASA